MEPVSIAPSGIERRQSVDFALMGFVKLTLVSPEETKLRQTETPTERLQRFDEKKRVTQLVADEQARIRKIEEAKAKAPVRYAGLIEIGTPLDAIMVKRDKPQSKVKLFIEGQPDLIVQMVGLKNINVPEQATMLVEVSQYKDGVIKEVRFRAEK